MSEKRQPPLDGVRVLEFGQVLAIPYAGMVLADQGAEVIKIEPPTGEASRFYTPPELDGQSPYYLHANRNKLGLALDLKSDEGRAAVMAMAANADVVLENYRAGVMDRLGIGYAALRAVNPGLVYCAVSGYGRSGPLADRAGYDPIAQAESGMMSMSGEKDGGPVRTGSSIVDMMTGVICAQAVTAALLARGDGGEGQYIEANLFGTAVNMLVNFAAQALLTGDNPSRGGNGSQAAQPSGVYASADGEFMLTVGGEVQYRRFCEKVLERPELADDPRFATNKARVDNRSELTEALNAVFATRPNAEWLASMQEHGVPAGEINSIQGALNSEMAAAVGLVGSAPHATLGELLTLMPSYALSGTPLRDPVAAPLLGQHTREVLAGVAGFDADRVEAMVAAGSAVEPG